MKLTKIDISDLENEIEQILSKKNAKVEEALLRYIIVQLIYILKQKAEIEKDLQYIEKHRIRLKMKERAKTDQPE